MRRRIRGCAAAFLPVVLVATACSHNDEPGAATPGGNDPAAASAPDTLRGHLVIAGAEPLTFALLHTVTAGVVALTGPGAREVRAVDGAEITVEGEWVAADRFEVVRFIVRTVDGQPAHDGVLLEEEGHYFLAHEGGQRTDVISPPEALRRMVGSRVWIAGPAGSAPHAFGLIASP
jgi:hypothetical protein